MTTMIQTTTRGYPAKNLVVVILSSLCHVCLLYVFAFVKKCYLLSLALLLLYNNTQLLLSPYFTGVYVCEYDVVFSKNSGGELAKEHIITIFPYLVSWLVHSIMNIICLHLDSRRSLFSQYFHFLSSYETFFFSLDCVKEFFFYHQSYWYVCIFNYLLTTIYRVMLWEMM